MGHKQGIGTCILEWAWDVNGGGNAKIIRENTVDGAKVEHRPCALICCSKNAGLGHYTPDTSRVLRRTWHTCAISIPRAWAKPKLTVPCFAQAHMFLNT